MYGERRLSDHAHHHRRQRHLAGEHVSRSSSRHSQDSARSSASAHASFEFPGHPIAINNEASSVLGSSASADDRRKMYSLQGSAAISEHDDDDSSSVGGEINSKLSPPVLILTQGSQSKPDGDEVDGLAGTQCCKSDTCGSLDSSSERKDLRGDLLSPSAISQDSVTHVETIEIALPYEIISTPSDKAKGAFCHVGKVSYV